MSFVVEVAPEVRRAVDALSPSISAFFQEQVRPILSESPYGYRDLIQTAHDSRGRRFYQYYDGIVPLVFLFRVYPDEDRWAPGERGFVYVFKAEDPWW
jgi:hypothetical protein